MNLFCTSLDFIVTWLKGLESNYYWCCLAYQDHMKKLLQKIPTKILNQYLKSLRRYSHLFLWILEENGIWKFKTPHQYWKIHVWSRKTRRRGYYKGQSQARKLLLSKLEIPNSQKQTEWDVTMKYNTNKIHVTCKHKSYF